MNMHWYNPKRRIYEDVPTSLTDEEALELLRGDINSSALVEHYVMLREEGMGIKQAMSVVGHRCRMWHLRYQPAR
jgi:hypothetical protein